MNDHTTTLAPDLEAHRLLAVREVAALLGVSVRAVWRLVSAGRLPAPVRISTRTVRWKLAEIRGYIDNLSAGDRK